MQAFTSIAQNWLSDVSSAQTGVTFQVVETNSGDALANDICGLAYSSEIKVFSIAYQPNTVADPLDLFHLIIQWFAEAYGADRIEQLIESHSYPSHRDILLNWYRREPHYRKEPLLYDEAGYEEQEFFVTLDAILNELAQMKPFVALVNQVDNAPTQMLTILNRMLDEQTNGRGWGVMGFISHSRKVRRIKGSDAWQDCLRRLERLGLILPFDHPDADAQTFPWHTPTTLKRFEDQYQMLLIAADLFAYADVVAIVEQVRRRYNDQHNGQLLFISAFCSLMRGELDSAVRDFVKVQNRLQSSETQSILVGSYFWQSICYTLQTHEKLARAAQEQCEKLALDYGDRRWYVLSQFATFYTDAHIAQHHLTQASLESLRYMLSELRYDNILALAQMQVYSHSEHGDEVTSRTYLRNCVRALRTVRRLRNMMGMSMCLHAMGVVYMRIGNARQTERLYQLSLTIREKYHRKADMVPMLNALGYFLVGQEKWQQAWDNFDRALTMLIEHRNFNEVSVTFYNFVWLYLQSGDVSRALTVLNNILELMRIRNVEAVPFRNLKDLNVLKGWLHILLNQPIQARYCLIRVQNLKHLHVTSFSAVLKNILSARLAFYDQEPLVAVRDLNSALQQLDESVDLDVYLTHSLRLEAARLFMDLRRNEDARPILAQLREQAYRLGLDNLAQRVSRASLGISSWPETVLPEISQPVHVLMDIARKETQLVAMQQQLSEVYQVNLLVELSVEEPDLDRFLSQVIGILDRRVPAEDFAILLVNDSSASLPLDLMLSNNVDPGKLARWRSHLMSEQPAEIRFEESGANCVAWPLRMSSVDHGWLLLSGDDAQQAVWNEAFIKLVAQQLGLILDRRMREALLEYQNRTDLLTGVLNRAGLFERLKKQFSQMKRQPQQSFALCYFDLDHFKYFNDQFGHDLGDRILNALTQTVTEHLRGRDELGRIGGDEFIILLSETSSQDAGLLLERIRALVASPDWWLPLLQEATGASDNPVPRDEWISASFGVVVVDHWPEQGISRIDLMAQGDSAMYQAKSQGKNCVVINNFQSES